jgi:hypothetical protein
MEGNDTFEYIQSQSPYPVVNRITPLNDYEARTVTFDFIENINIATPNDPNFYSGLKYEIYIDRNPGFYQKYYVGPAIIFVLISYSSFWISRAAAMARISLCTGSILMAV